MNTRSRRAAAAGSLLLVMGSMAFAGPKISVDAKEFDVGTIREGSMSSITHEFRIKNTGDSVLVIHEVRPG